MWNYVTKKYCRNKISNENYYNMLIYIIHYKKSRFFRRFNLTKVFTLTKRMSTLTKIMGHERHMVLLIEMTILTKCEIIHIIKKDESLKCPSRCPWPSQINHTKWPCLVKLAILIWLANLLTMPTIYLSTYLPIYLSIRLPIIYLPTKVQSPLSTYIMCNMYVRIYTLYMWVNV
jgi:hypothetical protein